MNMKNLRGRTMGRPVDRRAFLGGSVALTGGFLISGCDQSPEPSETGAPSASVSVGEKESPMLQTLVESGELPPLEERLPENPLVVEPTERVGTYGGEWTSGILGPGDRAWLLRTIGYDFLVRWTPQWDGVVANIAESYEAEDDGRAYVFRLRKGMKWSDGEPFTADDIVFAFDNVMSNKELSPAFPDAYAVGGEPGVLVKVDDYTVRIEFAEPYGLFIPRMATSAGADLTAYPRHYLEEFHKEYNADVGEGWVEEFLNRADIYFNPDIPRLYAWIVTVPFGEGTRVVAERNAYYWKTDPEGRQLPYLDSVVYEVASDPEVLLIKALDGEIDFQDRHIANNRNKPTLADGREEGNYDFYEARPATMNTTVLFPNHSCQDPVKREIFQNKDFRVGLSHAINRQEVIDVVYQGLLEPWQAAPRPDSDYYDEEMAKQYTEYNLDLANEALDRAGFTERDGDGFRLGPDGQRISFAVDVTANSVQHLDMLELVTGYWEEVGVEANANTMERSIFTARLEANQPEFSVWSGDGGAYYEVLLGPNQYVPLAVVWSKFAPGWAQWYTTDGASGVEPTEVVQEQLDLYDQVKSAVGLEEQQRLMREVLNIAKEQFYTIGIALTGMRFGLVKNTFHNVPESMPWSGIYPSPAPTNPEQYFEDQ